MNARFLLVAALGAAALTGCASNDFDDEGYGPPPPPAPAYGRPIGPGAIAGTVAADRNGDGVVDGFYTADGVFHPLETGRYCPPPPPPPPTKRGERG